MRGGGEEGMGVVEGFGRATNETTDEETTSHGFTILNRLTDVG